MDQDKLSRTSNDRSPQLPAVNLGRLWYLKVVLRYLYFKWQTQNQFFNNYGFVICLAFKIT